MENIETKRLILRPFRETDYENLSDLFPEDTDSGT